MAESTLTVSSVFAPNGEIPLRHTGFGEDLSPELRLEGLCREAKSLAVLMDDLDVPFCERYNHWLIWNLPVQSIIPEGIPHGEKLPELGNARQGIAYGKHCYRGPFPPFFIRRMHRYLIEVYALDALLELPATAQKNDLLRAMQGHILQQGCLEGNYQRK